MHAFDYVCQYIQNCNGCHYNLCLHEYIQNSNGCQDSNCLHECQDNICMPLIMYVNIFKTAMDVWIDTQFWKCMSIYSKLQWLLR